MTKKWKRHNDMIKDSVKSTNQQQQQQQAIK